MFWARELIASAAPSRRRPQRSPRTARAVAAYLGLAIGDALGATVEFMSPREIRAKYGVHRDIVGGGWLHLKPGQVTDDTTMSLALGDAILAHGRVDATIAADAFDGWMRRKPVDIGNTVRRNLIAYRKTATPEAPPSEHDAGNGAVMRLLPVVLATLDLPLEEALAAQRAQAHVTHHNGLSDAAGEMLVRLLRDLLEGRPAECTGAHAAALAASFPVFAWTGKREENPSGYIVDTLRAVCQSFYSAQTFTECLIDVVNRGGDADTTGAIAGMLAGARFGLSALPERWLARLDPAIKAHCEQQADALLQLHA